MSTKLIKQFIGRHKIELLVLVSILLLASFLRLYKIREFLVFLGDEGRDALVVKRMIVDHDLTLLGPTASVGGFYLGPLYYYMMIPAMILSHLDPVGPAIMVAIMGVATVALLYYVIRDWFGTFPAQIVSLLYAASPGIVVFSRSSWNPNPMPLFSLLTIACLHYALNPHTKLGSKNKTPKTVNLKLAFLSAFFFSIASIHLHYLGLLLAPIMLVIMLLESPLRSWLKLTLAQILGFLVAASPFFAFEVRHNFLNTRSAIEFISRGGSTTGLRSYNLAWLFYEINRFNFESILGSRFGPITPWITYGFFVSIIIFLFVLIKQKRNLTSASTTILIFWALGILGISMYKGQLRYHYFEFLFPAPFLVLGLILSVAKSVKFKFILAVVALAATSYLVIKEPIWVQGSNLVNQTQRIAEEAIKLSNDQPFNFALITPGNSDHAYRFFLEIENHKPVLLEDQVTSQLIVACEADPADCHPLGNSLWEIAGFGRAEITNRVVVPPGITLFRLIHHPDSLDRIGHPAPQG